jgi:hypothetical protein
MVQVTQVGGRWPQLSGSLIPCLTRRAMTDMTMCRWRSKYIASQHDILRARLLSRHEIAIPTCGSTIFLYRTHRCIASASSRSQRLNFGSLVVWAERCRLLDGKSDRAASRTRDKSRPGWCHSEGCLDREIWSGLHGDRPY